MVLWYQCIYVCRSRWPRSLRHRSAATRLLKLWVRIPPRALMSVCCECYMLSGRGLCDELITRPEESHRPWCDFVYYLETSWMRRSWPTGGCFAQNSSFLMKATADFRSMQERKKVTVYGICKSNSVYDLTVFLRALIKGRQIPTLLPQFQSTALQMLLSVHFTTFRNVPNIWPGGGKN
jgi:hypothetical protein